MNVTTSRKCRVCGNGLYAEPILRYENMPKIAQFLPDKDMLAKDEGMTLGICQCSACGLVQLDCEPVPYYKDVIRAAAVSDEMKRFRAQEFRQFIDRHSLQNKKMIEIGCGNGEYLSILAGCGVGAFGLENSSEAVKRCAAAGLNAAKGYLDKSDFKIPSAPFDAFMILNFLEHFPDPNAALRCIYNNLMNGAVGIVEVPNFDMIVKKKMFSEFMSDHLLYFTKQTLEFALNMNGFDVIELAEHRSDYIISATVKKRAKIDLSEFIEHEKDMKNDISAYLYTLEGKRIAVWGASHQALAILSIANMSGKIKYVVDSAKFKQGKFTPVTHIPIVSPEALEKDPVDAIIVMAASYSDEVAEIIKNKYGAGIKVAILRDFGLESAQ